jgi:hypothetical protein
MVLPSFGFLVGDLLAVAQLPAQIYTALDDAHGSETEYKDTLKLLRSLSDSMNAIKIFIDELLKSATGMPPPDVSLIAGLKGSLDRYKNLMEEFMYVTPG